MKPSRDDFGLPPDLCQALAERDVTRLRDLADLALDQAIQLEGFLKLAEEGWSNLANLLRTRGYAIYLPWTVSKPAPALLNLDLSTRSLNVLLHGGINTLDKLTALKLGEFAGLPQSGPKTFFEVIERLARHSAPDVLARAKATQMKRAANTELSGANGRRRPGHSELSLQRLEERQLFSLWLEPFSERERAVLRCRYGLEADTASLNAHEIAERFAMTPGRVSQLATRLLRELASPVRLGIVRPLTNTLWATIISAGGLATEPSLARALGRYLPDDVDAGNAARLLMLAHADFYEVPALHAWCLSQVQQRTAPRIVEAALLALSTSAAPYGASELVVQARSAAHAGPRACPDGFIKACIRASEKITARADGTYRLRDRGVDDHVDRGMPSDDDYSPIDTLSVVEVQVDQLASRDNCRHRGDTTGGNGTYEDLLMQVIKEVETQLAARYSK